VALAFVRVKVTRAVSVLTRESEVVIVTPDKVTELQLVGDVWFPPILRIVT
jgi:hypothetical protein